jgi:hypothetical protein
MNSKNRIYAITRAASGGGADCPELGNAQEFTMCSPNLCVVYAVRPPAAHSTPATHQRPPPTSDRAAIARQPACADGGAHACAVEARGVPIVPGQWKRRRR